MREAMETPDSPSALILADRLAALGTLVAGVAHEVNNPITYVIGNLAEIERLTAAMREALVGYRRAWQERGGSDELAASIEAKLSEVGGLGSLDEILTDALEGASRIRDLIRDLLSLSRESDPSCEVVNVHEVLDSTLRLASRRLGPVARVSREYGAESHVSGDRTRLSQVFLNLLTNAIDACAIDACAIDAAQPADPSGHLISVRTEDVADGIAIEITDSGDGIPRELQPRLFTPFFTTKKVGEGTGLGLYISRRIIESHGGRLDFRSDGGSGTTFRVFLPSRSRSDGGGG
jgi:signal transduction histidine kinase